MKNMTSFFLIGKIGRISGARATLITEVPDIKTGC
jgi:hypothetical protein|tara:strand:+ start:254 stop:358 length:105 start_codon:yes stop_codon:yes gene_type:complete